MHYRLNYLHITFVCVLLCFCAPGNAQTNVAFPLQLSGNKRYLVDKNGAPFLIKEFSSWGLIQAFPEREAEAFLDSLKEKGFNTVISCLIFNTPSQIKRSSPSWDTLSPFNVRWDFTTPNEEYFKHVDRFFKMAGDKGFFVMALPCYLGYPFDGPQGMWDEMLDPHNDTAKMRKYGEFVGNRYKNTGNIIWVAGGDNNADDKLFYYENALVQGIRSVDKNHLWTGHFDTNRKVHWSSQHPVWGKMMDVDGEYVWTETVLLDEGPQYRMELAQYNKGKMTMQMDLSYERDVPHFADNENYQWIRRKMYDGLLSGCKGTSFGTGDYNNLGYTLDKWALLMNTKGMQQVSYCFKLFQALPWHLLVPDQTNDIIYSGRGTFGSRDYICAAKASDSSCYVIYIPRGQVFYMNVKSISGKPMHMHWFNPRTGEFIKIGTAETREQFGIAPPSEEDWVLVYDLNGLKL